METPYPDPESGFKPEDIRDIAETYDGIDEENLRRGRLIPDELPDLPGGSPPARHYALLQDSLHRLKDTTESYRHGEKAHVLQEQKKVLEVLALCAAFHQRLQDKIAHGFEPHHGVTIQMAETETEINASARPLAQKVLCVEQITNFAVSYLTFYDSEEE